MLMSEGRFGARDIVSVESLRQMLTPWDGNVTGPAMAWGVGTATINHAANTRTFSARVAMLPAEGYGLVVLANVNSGPLVAGTADLVGGVVRILRGATVRLLAFETGIAVLVLAGLPRWLGVPLLTIVEYFPDLGLAMIASVGTGILTALMRSLVLPKESATI